MYIDREALIRSLSYATKFTGDQFAAESLRVIRLSAPDGASVLDVWASNGRALFMDSIPLDTMTHFPAPVFIHIDQVKPVLAWLNAVKSVQLEMFLTDNGLAFRKIDTAIQYMAPLCDDVDAMPWDALVDLAACALPFSGTIPHGGMPIPVKSFALIMRTLASYTPVDDYPTLCKVYLPGVREQAAFDFRAGTLRIIDMAMRADADNFPN